LFGWCLFFLLMELVFLLGGCVVRVFPSVFFSLCVGCGCVWLRSFFDVHPPPRRLRIPARTSRTVLTVSGPVAVFLNLGISSFGDRGLVRTLTRSVVSMSFVPLPPSGARFSDPLSSMRDIFFWVGVTVLGPCGPFRLGWSGGWGISGTAPRSVGPIP